MFEHAAGGIVWHQTELGAWMVLLIRDKHEQWSLPKGHLEGDETEAQAAAREVEEETGVRCVIGPLLKRIAYPIHKKKGWRLKRVAYFLASAQTTALIAATDEGISDVRWCMLDEALALIGYAQIRDLVRQSYDRVQQQAFR